MGVREPPAGQIMGEQALRRGEQPDIRTRTTWQTVASLMFFESLEIMFTYFIFRSVPNLDVAEKCQVEVKMHLVLEDSTLPPKTI